MKPRSVKIGNRTINIDEKGHVDVITEDASNGSTKEQLRKIAKEIGFAFDEVKENTQSLGQKLVRFINDNSEFSEGKIKNGEETELKTIYVYVGGQEGHYLECMSCDEDVLKDLQSDDDSEAIEEQLDKQDYQEGRDYSLMWAIQPFDEDYETNVRVTDSNDNEIFSDIMTYNQNLGKVKDWKFDENVDESINRSLTEKFKTLAKEYKDEDELLSESCAAVGRAIVQSEVKKAYERNGLNGDERLTLLAHYYDTYPFEYMFEVKIHVGEDFDINKLSLFCFDYEDFAPDYCNDSVAPFIKYGNVIYQGVPEGGLESDCDYYGFATLAENSTDYLEFEGGDF